MNLDLQIDELYAGLVNITELEQVVMIALQQFDQTGAAVTVVITGNETVQALNQQYRGLDAPTDVLSFGNTVDPDFPQVDPAVLAHLGDIVIAYPIAEAQAVKAGHAVNEELTLLVIHGLLHLLGFDHDLPETKAQMWQIQAELMQKLGLSHVQPTEV